MPRTSSTVNSKLLCNLLLPSTTAHSDLNLTHASRDWNPRPSGSGTATRTRSYSQLPALLEDFSKSVQAPRTLGQDLEVQQTFDFTLCNLSALEDCRQIFTSATFAVSLFFDDSSTVSWHNSGRRRCSITFLRAVFSALICDVKSSSDHCPARFPSLLALVWVIFLNLLLNYSEFWGHNVASEVLVILVQLLGVHRLAHTFLLLPLLVTLLEHVCSMRPAFRLHAVFSTALVLCAT